VDRTESRRLWAPSAERIEAATITRYARWIAETRGVEVTGSYDDLWRSSVADLDAFWASIWEFFAVESDFVPDRVLGSRDMPGAEWFPGTRLSFPEEGEGVVVLAPARFAQIEPKVLLTVDGYRYAGKDFDRRGPSRACARSFRASSTSSSCPTSAPAASRARSPGTSS